MALGGIRLIREWQKSTSNPVALAPCIGMGFIFVFLNFLYNWPRLRNGGKSACLRQGDGRFFARNRDNTGSLQCNLV
jgi:hypothetical protein